MMSLEEAKERLEKAWEYARTQECIIDKVLWALLQVWIEAEYRFQGRKDERDEKICRIWERK